MRLAKSFQKATSPRFRIFRISTVGTDMAGHSAFFQGEPIRKRWWLWILVGWLSLILIQVTQNYAFCITLGMPWSWTYSLRYALVEFVFWAIMTSVVAHWAQRFPLTGTSRGRHLAILFSLTLFTLLGHAIYRVPLHRVMYNDPQPRAFLHLFVFQLVNNSLTDTCIFWAVVGICQAIRSVRRSQQREQELTKAQLEMLKGQLQPHFLFNTLNSISWLMRKDVEAADNMMTSLSDLLRTALSVPGSEEVTLREELHVLDLYLTIERARFRSRLTVLITVEPEALDCKVPGLLLQPIVENAVRHGVARVDGPSLVEIRAQREGGALCLSILDNGPGISEEISRREGIGMANTRERLEKYYGPAQSFRYSNRAAGGLSVNIRLPFRVSNGFEERDERHEVANSDC
jgi:two-component system LytT family sensor kinase